MPDWSIGQQVPSTAGRRLVIPDIHGCLYTYLALIRRIGLNQNDQLFLLGDLINKGSHNARLLHHLIHSKPVYQRYILMGNHDYYYLKHLLDDPFYTAKMHEEGAWDLLDASSMTREEHLGFLQNLPYYLDLGDYLLVHGGFNFKLKNMYKDIHGMLHIRNMQYDNTTAQNKTIVHGHTPTELSLIIRSIKEKNKVIPLDNGCVYHPKNEQGNLLCLDLDSQKLYAEEKDDRD